MPAKKAKPLRAEKLVKSVARNVIGSPPPTRRAPDKTRVTGEKHKPTLGQLLQEK